MDMPSWDKLFRKSYPIWDHGNCPEKHHFWMVKWGYLTTGKWAKNN